MKKNIFKLVINEDNIDKWEKIQSQVPGRVPMDKWMEFSAEYRRTHNGETPPFSAFNKFCDDNNYLTIEDTSSVVKSKADFLRVFKDVIESETIISDDPND